MLRDADGWPPHGYRLQVLGGWHLVRDGEPLRVPQRSQRLIAYLAVAGPSPRVVLCGHLWPASTEHRALDSLRVAIHHVGRDLPGLLSRHDTMLALAPAVAVDLDRERAELTGTLEPDTACGGGNNTAGGWFGREPDLLPGWYEDWVLEEQDRLRAQRIRHHASTAQRLLDSGDLRAAIDAAGRARGLDPLDEWSLEVLVRAQVGVGAVCAARRVLLAFRHDLHQEFGQFSSPVLDELDRLVTSAAADMPGTPSVESTHFTQATGPRLAWG
ncbi:BTAD domain-containing putative transcriptional regulator [Arthrobacter sp. JSM 101049]|uniref:AfsR/SARP family transcriptional regulator n=1 Tax=Arthrobacter sp. JSM 101049 TaxID=929097 RepID=UPI003565C083